MLYVFIATVSLLAVFLGVCIRKTIRCVKDLS